LVQAPAGFVVNLLVQITLPAYSAVQEQNARINVLFLRTTGLLFALGFPALTFLFFCGKALLGLAYGPQFRVMSNCLLLAACVAVLNIHNTIPTTIFYAKGRPQLHRRAVASMAIIVAVLVYPASHFLGAAGAQVGCLIAIAVGYCSQLLRLRSLTEFSFPAYFRKALPPASIAAVVFAICLVAAQWPALRQPGMSVALGIAGSGICYALLLGTEVRSSRPLQQV
jgi:O-antigen/teichoic acid export membrane protein